MTNEQWIDKTDFGTIRRYLAAARSPISCVLFVATRDMLLSVAAKLADPTRRGSTAGEWQIRWWVSAGLMRLGVPEVREASEVAIDMERIGDSDSCSVLFLPPAYLVHVPGLEEFRPCAQRLPRHRNYAAPEAEELR